MNSPTPEAPVEEVARKCRLLLKLFDLGFDPNNSPDYRISPEEARTILRALRALRSLSIPTAEPVRWELRWFDHGLCCTVESREDAEKWLTENPNNPDKPGNYIVPLYLHPPSHPAVKAGGEEMSDLVVEARLQAEKATFEKAADYCYSTPSTETKEDCQLGRDRMRHALYMRLIAAANAVETTELSVRGAECPEADPNVLVPKRPEKARIEAGAARLAEYEANSVWPDSFNPLDVRQMRIEAEKVYLTMVNFDAFSPTCPACLSQEYNQFHHDGTGGTPECWWWECQDCGYKTKPE